jgi:hypothetical protein
VVAALARSVGRVTSEVTAVPARALVADFDPSRLPAHDTRLDLQGLAAV